MADRKKPTGLLDAFYNVGSGISSDLGTVADWFADSYQDPVGSLKGVGSAIAGAAQHTAELPKRAFESSETMRLEGPYNPEPIVEAATLPMGTGAIAGVPLKAGEGVLGSGFTRKLDKATGGYIGSNSPIRQVGDQIGTHITTLPNVAVQDSLWPTMGNLSSIISPKTTPVVADINKYFKFPRDPVDWADPAAVVDFTKAGVEMGLPFPKGVLSGLESAAKQSGGLKENLIPMMQEKGYDAIKYPRDPGDIRIPYHYPNSFMVFDQSKVLPKYSPEGQDLIKSRGLAGASKELYMDEANRAWMTASDRTRNLVNWVRNDPGAFATLSKDEKKDVLRLLSKAKIKE